MVTVRHRNHQTKVMFLVVIGFPNFNVEGADGKVLIDAIEKKTYI